MTCNQCGKELQIGDYPFCSAPGGHGSTLPSRAQHFDPIVVHVSHDGEYRFPASTDAPVPAGYAKVEIRTIQEADRISREVNAREDSTLRQVQHQSDAGRAATRARNRAFMNNLRDRMSPAGRQFLDQAREYQEQKDRQRENTRPRSTNFHIEVFANDSSNRESHSDERTGWRSRKG
jgi:hypothetical protein